MTQADVLVSGVKRSPNGNHIEFVRVHLPLGGLLGEAVDIRRENLIYMIQHEGKNVVTGFDEDRAGCSGGAAVRVTSHRYLRTDSNNIAEDNLGDLPEFHHLFSHL